MSTSTKYAAVTLVKGVTYYDNGCRTVEGLPYITTCGRSAKNYNPPGTPGPTPPEGFVIEEISYASGNLGGGFIWESGPTGP